MRSRMYKSGPFLLMLLTMCVLVYCRFKKLIACPSCYLFSNGSDGLKNYFTSAWYVKHDGGLWFTGMNYPYGEHIVYTDNQPAWSILMKGLNAIVPLDVHVIGITNMLLLVALIACAVVVYFILRELNLPRWYAALLSVPIALLSPQLERFNGHYSLAYTCYIPVLILLGIRWYRSEFSWQKSLTLFGAIFFMGFTHLYYLFIALTLYLSHGLVRLAGNRFKIDRKLVSLIAVVFIAVIMVYGVVKVTDPIVDRPVDVYGLDVYTARAEGTFLPWYEPFSGWWESLRVHRPGPEGISYIGLGLTLLLPLLLAGSLRIFRRRRKIARQDHPSNWLLGGTLVWLFATGWIYAIGAGLLIDVFPVLGQFRSLGRLAWTFYYLAAIGGAYLVFVWLRSKKFARPYVVIAALMLTIFTGEALGHLWQSTTGVFRANLVFRHTTPYADLLEKKQLAPEHFQAILQFPSLLIGPEKITISRGGWVIGQSMQCAWETGLPMITSMMSRTSVSQGMDFIELTSAGQQVKKRVQSMDDRPILLLTTDDQLKPFEQRIMDRAEFLGDVAHMQVHSLSIATLRALEPVATERQILFRNSFDERSSPQIYQGGGAFQNGREWTTIYEGQFAPIDSGSYQLAVMAYVAHDSPGIPVIREEVFSPSGDLVFKKQHSHFNYDLSGADGDWLKLIMPIAYRGSNLTHRFQLETSEAIIDELEVVVAY